MEVVVEVAVVVLIVRLSPYAIVGLSTKYESCSPAQIPILGRVHIRTGLR
jgi:hypothetical protein